MSTKINAIYSTPYDGDTSVTNGEFKGRPVIPVSGSLTGSLSGSNEIPPLVLNNIINVFSKVEPTSNYAQFNLSANNGDSIYVSNYGNEVLKIEHPVTKQIELVPPDGNLYRSAAIGNNTWTPIVCSTLFNRTSYELLVNHTTGTARTWNIGLRPISASGTPSVSIVGGALNLTPSVQYWDTIRRKRAWATDFLASSNVRIVDLASNQLNDSILCDLWTAYMPTVSTTNLDSIATIAFNDPATPGNYYDCEVVTVANSYTGEIGDNGTLYGSKVTDMMLGCLGSSTSEVGIRATSISVSEHWFIFSVRIPASAATKVYKFVFNLEGFYI